MKYQTAHDGQWLQPVRKGYRLACCDCSLVHVLDFRVVGGRVQFRATRDGRATKRRRLRDIRAIR